MPQAALRITAGDGSVLTASRTYFMSREDNADMNERREYGILSGLHWLQRRQRPKGGWQGGEYEYASYSGDLIDYLLTKVPVPLE